MTGKEITPPIEIDNASLGPAMQSLTPAMRAFVVAKVFRGFNNKECARWAGYSAASEKALAVQAHTIAHDPRVQKAIREEGEKLMRGEGPASIRTLIEIRDDPTVEKKDRIKCAVELLNRSGFHAVTESISHVELHMTESQKDARILALAAELGLSKDEARKMLVAPDEKIIDAAYQEITPPRELTEEEKKYRARRDRDNEQDRLKRSMTAEQLAEHKAKTRAEKSERSKLEYQQAQQQENGDIPDADSQPVAETVDDDPYADIRDLL